MEFIFECLGSEFQGVEFTSMNVNPTHSVSYSKKGEIENVITLTVSVYNNVHKMVGKKIFKFVNDKYKVSPSKKLDYITAEALESAFTLSKEAIIKEIYDDYKAKYDAILEKLDKLTNYYESENKQVE